MSLFVFLHGGFKVTYVGTVPTGTSTYVLFFLKGKLSSLQCGFLGISVQGYGTFSTLIALK